MAMPAMREGDTVIARIPHRIPGLNVIWADDGIGVVPRPRRVHMTDAWLEAVARTPVKHSLMPVVERMQIVIAPDVSAKPKRWNGWRDLIKAIPDAIVVTSAWSRSAWMRALNRAHTVICPDTGTVHMADALGVPKVIGLYGSRLSMFGPYWSKGSHCIERDGMSMTVSDVMAVVNG